MERLLLVDVGSTTTKAILLEREEGGWLFTRREAPTTVEAPHSDVAVGLLAALSDLSRATGVTLVDGGAPALPLFATSSAGGGLTMVVTGLVKSVTASSAERAALGAGALVLDTIALDDGRVPYRKVEALQALRPDMLLFAGGFDGDAVSGPVLLAELVRESALRPRLDPAGNLPVLYAGNRHARDLVAETLGDRFLFLDTENLRPESDRENLEPARTAIHEVFMEHVMSHAPGYGRLAAWVDAPILPTPSAVGLLLATLTARDPGRMLVVDIGGATTDVFTAEGGEVFRTVSPNVGMSYSALNVARTAGTETLSALLGGSDERDLLDRIGEKHARPTRLPATPEDVRVERALATAAVREAVREHLAVLSGAPLSRDEETLSLRSIGRRDRAGRAPRGDLALEGYDVIVGSGGILSHSPREVAANVLVAALGPTGVVRLAVDRAFLFPHLGVIAKARPERALELLDEIGFVPLATLVAPRRRRKVRVRIGDETRVADAGRTATGPLEPDDGRELQVKARGLPRRPPTGVPTGGRLGLLLDARGRPVADPASRPFEEPTDPPPPRDEVDRGEAVESGRLRVRRELLLPGEVLVAAGDTLTPETLVAHATRTFPRPFFLDAATELGVDGGELAPHLLVAEGDAVAAKQVIAERTGPMGTRLSFRSPVTGTVERVLGDGRVVVREAEETLADLAAVSAAEELGIRPAELRDRLCVEEGEEVSRDQPLARVLSSVGYRSCRSPIRGTVQRIDHEFGIVLVAPLAEELTVHAALPGVVAETTDRGAVVEGEGIRVRGLWGIGGEAAGPLAVEDPRDGHVLAATRVVTGDLAAFAEAGVRGLVTGGVPLADLLGSPPPFPVVVTEGFGARDLPAAVLDRLRPFAGRPALLDATTELRAGVRRPFLAVFA